MKKICLSMLIFFYWISSNSVIVYAITEAEVKSVGKEAATGSVFIWFLCAIAFLKISQKIDSFMSSLGINVGNTGSSMLTELLVAAKGVSSINKGGGASFRNRSYNGSSSYNNSRGSSFLSGGLAGAVSRQFTQSAVNSANGSGGNPISKKVYEKSVQAGGEFANSVISTVAQGNINSTGTIKGPQAAQALTSYLGESEMPDAPKYNDVEIGGGRIMGTETSIEHPEGIAFGMYQVDQYMPPSEGSYETVTTADNTVWYKQYATDTVERTPFMTDKGKIAYREEMVQKLPKMPPRKDRI